MSLLYQNNAFFKNSKFYYINIMKDYMQFIKTYSDNNCSEYDIIQNNEKIAYYVEHINHPLTEEKLDNPVFELYYDYDDEEFTASVIADSLNDALEYADII